MVYRRADFRARDILCAFAFLCGNIILIICAVQLAVGGVNKQAGKLARLADRGERHCHFAVRKGIDKAYIHFRLLLVIGSDVGKIIFLCRLNTGTSHLRVGLRRNGNAVAVEIRNEGCCTYAQRNYCRTCRANPFGAYAEAASSCRALCVALDFILVYGVAL